MNIVRGAGRWFLSLLIVGMVAAWIGAATAQTTIFNKDTVKRWLASSGAYDKALESFFTLENDQGAATKEDLQRTFSATFPPHYIQQQTETALDTTYEWVNGQKQTIDFSVPVEDKRDEFAANLRKQIEPRIAALPVCPTHVVPAADKPACIPQGMKASELVDQLVRLSEDNNFLKQPITPASFTQDNQPQPSSLSAVPVAANTTRVLAFMLPLGILLCAAAYTLLSQHRLRGLALISKRICFQGLLFGTLGGLLWWFSRMLDLTTSAQSGDPQQLLVLQNIANPVLRHALPEIGQMIVVFSLTVAVVSGVSWLTSVIVRRRLERTALLHAPVDTSFPPKPPANQITPPKR